ncbi:MAG: hypothetical protein ACTSQY_00645 [Candidatus Odinarchaeia archaeon]
MSDLRVRFLWIKDTSDGKVSPGPDASSLGAVAPDTNRGHDLGKSLFRWDDCYFYNVDVSNDLDVSGTKNFKITHPSDADKWLRHSSLEGPFVGTVYKGQSTLSNGSVTITLPDYFWALNKHTGFSYSLTPIGNYSKLYISKEPDESNTFEVSGDVDVTFSWILIGERDNATLIIEENKEEI